MDFFIKKISRREHLDRIPDRWRAAYGKGYYAGDNHKQRIQRAIDALERGRFTPDAVSAIIGNTSWSDFKCDCCGENKEELLQFGQEPDYEARYLDLCESCVNELSSYFT